MLEDDVSIWGDGSTYKGNDIERFYRYGLLANPALRIYKPWLDADFVGRSAAAQEMSEWLLAHGLPYHDSAEKAYSTDANIWGPPTRPRASSTSTSPSRSSSRSWASAFWDPPVEIAPEDVTIEFEQGRPVTINGKDFASAVDLVLEANADRRPARPGHVRPDREPDHRGQEPGHLRGARHGAAARRLRAAGQRDPQRGHRRQLPQRGPAWAGCCTRAVARPAGADAAESCSAGSRRSPARSRWAAARRGLLDPRHRGPVRRPTTPDKLSMERTEDSAFGPVDRIGQLTMRNLDIADTAQGNTTWL